MQEYGQELGSCEALLRVEQFGTVQWQTMENAFCGCKNMQFAEGIDTPDLSKVTDMNNMFSGCASFNHDLGMWKLEKCEKLGLDNCGMSVENYSKSLVGWAAQTNITQGLQLSTRGLRYNANGKTARKQLIKGKNWRIRGDADENGRPFITRWKGEAGKELRIPINGNDYKLIIKKASDGSVLATEYYHNDTYSYTPTEDGELLVEAGPDGVSNMYNGSGEALLRVEQFGTVQWQTMENAFRGCKNMQFAEGIDTPDLSQVTDMRGMFSGCTSFNQPLNDWDVSKVTNMSDMFDGCSSFNQPLNNWDVSQVTDMRGMFSGCSSFNQPLNNWDVSQVRDMGSSNFFHYYASGMFSGCTSFNQPLNNWNVSKVTDMGGMFKGCTSFNQDLGMWKLECCQKLGLDNCGMSVENFSKSLVGWAAQANIKQGLILYISGLKCDISGNAALKKLKEEKHWEIRSPFITRWKGEAEKELRIPINGYDYNAYRLIIKRASDGSVLATEYHLHSTYSYTPTEDGELLVEADPEGVSSIRMNEGSAEALLRVEQFGTVQWQTMAYAFYGCKNMQFAEGIDTPDLSQVTDMSAMFDGCISFNQPLNNWNVSQVRDMSAMFSHCISFNQPLNNWNVSQVRDMSAMFSHCISFNQPLNNWNVSQVTDMSGMFYGCTSFNQPLNNWNVSNVQEMGGMKKHHERALGMFQYCSSFNQPLDNWDVSNVWNMSNMFYGCTSFNQPLNNWDVSQVRDMSAMFSHCTSFNQDLGMWKLKRCQELGLYGCGMSVENYSKSLVGWAAQTNITQGLQLRVRGLRYDASGKAARVKLISEKSWRIFGDSDIDVIAKPFITRWRGEAGKELSIPIKGVGYKLVIKRASDNTILKTEPSLIIGENYYYFDEEAYKFTPTEDGELLVEAGPDGVSSMSMKEGSAEALLRVEQFGTVQWQTMKDAFRGCTNLQLTEGIDTPDLSQVTDMREMFYGCTSFNQPLNNWNVSHVTNMSGMFFGCTSFNQSLNSWDVSQVKDMQNMFYGCTSFNQPLNNWNVSQVTNMKDMFSGCTSFNQPLNNWNVSQVTDMSGMFYGCTSFNQPLNNWNVSNVQKMGGMSNQHEPALGMFQYCSSFNQPLDNWDVKNVEGMIDMFAGCTSFDQNLGMWKLEKCEKLGLNLCGMSVENYSNSLVGWAAQPNIREELHLDAEGLSYNETGNAARTKLKAYKHWTITGDGKASHSIAFVPNRLTLNPAEEKELVLKKTEIEDQEEVTLTTSDPTTVQIVDAASFKIKGLKLGKATVTARIAPSATHGELIAKCEVTVRVVITGVKLSQNKLTLKKDDSFTLVATLEPSTASNKAVMWTTSNDAVVSVSDNGVIQAKAVGVAVITVTTQEGAFTATCEVTVTEEDVVLTGLRLSPSETRLKVGGEATLSVTYEPAGATQREVTWSTSDAAIVTVDEHGKVKAIAAGEATITVASKTNASIQATCKVIVEPVTAVEDAMFANVAVAPNPFDSQLRIINGDLRGTYALLNAQGIVVSSGNMTDNEVLIETSDLTLGLYLLRLTAENGATKTITVVKER